MHLMHLMQQMTNNSSTLDSHHLQRTSLADIDNIPTMSRTTNKVRALKDIEYSAQVVAGCIAFSR